MENIFISLLNTSITAGYLVIAVMLLRPLLKKAPKYIRCILWGLVGLRLILPFSFESVLSLIPSAEPIPPEIVTSPAPVIHSGITFVNSAVNPVISQSFAPAPEASVNPMQVVMAVAWNVWLLGVIAMVLYSVISFVLLKRKLREAVQDGGNVWVCDRVSSPFLLGLFRPKIYLPSDLAESSKVYVLAHENAHIRRKDHWWKPLGFLLLTVYWFNPLMWVAYIFLCRDIEFACDEKVIKELGTDCKCAYSEALINCSVPRRMISACPVAFGEDGVKGRIKSVLNYKKPAFWIILIALILCIVVAVCFLTNPPEDEQPAKIPANEYRFRATVVEIYEDSLLVEPLEKEEYFSGAKQVVIRLNGRSKDDYRLGCIVEVIYDSQIQETMPPVIPNASSIFNLDMVSSHLPDPYYSFTATVTEVLDDCIIVKYQHFPLHNFEFSYYQVNTDPTGYAVGYKVNIAYDGTVTETEPYDILGEVYSIEIAEAEFSIGQPVLCLDELYPQFHGLDTFKGLEVYVWKNGTWRCGVRSGTNRLATQEELWAFGEGVTLETMALILSTYRITRDEVAILYSYDPAFSGAYPNVPTTEQQAFIEDTLFAYLPQRIIMESYYISPDYSATEVYPVVVCGYKFGENSWEFQFFPNTTIADSIASAKNQMNGMKWEEAYYALKEYDLDPSEIPVVVIQHPLSSYYYEINEQTAAEARIILGLIKLSNSDEPTPTEAGPESSGNGYALENGYYSLSGSGKDSFATPYIYIDTTKKTANIGGSPLMSYSESGRYYLLFDRLIVKAQNTTYTFQIQDKNTLVLLSDRGYDKSPIPASGTYVFCGEYPQ